MSRPHWVTVERAESIREKAEPGKMSATVAPLPQRGNVCYSGPAHGRETHQRPPHGLHHVHSAGCRFPTPDTTEAVIFDLDDCCSTLSLSFERFSSVRHQACGFVTPWPSTNG